MCSCPPTPMHFYCNGVVSAHKVFWPFRYTGACPVSSSAVLSLRIVCYFCCLSACGEGLLPHFFSIWIHILIQFDILLMISEKIIMCECGKGICSVPWVLTSIPESNGFVVNLSQWDCMLGSDRCSPEDIQLNYLQGVTKNLNIRLPNLAFFLWTKT